MLQNKVNTETNINKNISLFRSEKTHLIRHIFSAKDTGNLTRIFTFVSKLTSTNSPIFPSFYNNQTLELQAEK